MQPPPVDRVFAVMAGEPDTAITWGQMAISRNRIAHSLSAQLPANIVGGAIYSKNSVQWLLCHQVCQAMGLRFSPVNWHLAPSEVEYIVNDCDADVVFFGVDFADSIESFRARAPNVKAWVCMDGNMPGCLSLASLCDDAPEDAPAPVHSRSGGMIGYTGGTTGKPKGAVRAGKPMDPKRAMATVTEWGLLKMMPTPKQLVAAPLYHAMPMAWYSVGLALGTSFVLMPKFDAAAALHAIEEHQINGFYMPPILLKRLLQFRQTQSEAPNLSSVKCICSSGAACPTLVKQGVTEMFGPVLHEIYGASELGAVTVMDPEHMLLKPKSCGKPAYGIELCVQQALMLLDDHKNPVTTAGQPGEIFAKGFNIDGYHKQAEKTADAQVGEFFSVGDVGYLDEDGYLYISDRKIDMVVSGGANIYPAQVEEILHQHPAIEDVAVFGLPDPEFGEKVHAAVKLVAGQHLTAKSLLAWCAGKIGKFQLPRESDVSFHNEDFPRSDAGKLRKKVLRASVIATRSMSKL